MKLKQTSEKCKVIRYWPDIFVGTKHYIFLVSHMRSRSSVLSHILGSNPEISGYSEMSQSYLGLKDFMELRYKVWAANSRNLTGRYVFDKILHNRYCFSESVLRSSTVHFCYLLRKPEDTIKSITQLVKMHSGAEIWKHPEQATAYYVDRITQMTEYVKRSSGQSFFLESDDLVNNTQGVLDAISHWLSLDESLSSEYSIFEKTGKAGYGDPSKSILEGQVIQKKCSYKNISIPATLLERTEESYEHVRRILQNNCVHL